MIAAPGTDGLTVALLLPHTAASALAGRRAVGQDLAARGVADPLREATILVLSELLSNAVKHGRPLADGKVRLAWEVSPDGIELEVTDGGAATRPRAAAVPPTETGGRGLAIVGELASEWGVRDERDALTVWARVASATVAARSPRQIASPPPR